MITDEELTAELTQALRSRTEHLTYSGSVPRAHRPIAATVAPLAATAAATAVLGWSALTSDGPVTGPVPGDVTVTTAGPGQVASAPIEAPVVTDQIELAGLTFTYTRGAAEPPLTGECPPDQEPTSSCYVASWSTLDRVPAGAEEFDVDGTTVWVGKDPGSGLAGLYLQADTSVVAILSETRTLDQMRELAGTLQLG